MTLPNPRSNAGGAEFSLEWLRSNTRATTHDCWEWLGNRDSKGYGKVRIGRLVRRVHRLAYELAIGPIPDRLVLDHKCRNPSCCNPDHLEAVTTQENTRRGESLVYVGGTCPRCGSSKLYKARWGHRCAGCLRAYESTPERAEKRRAYEQERAKDPQRQEQRREACARYNARKRAESAGRPAEQLELAGGEK